MHKNHWQYLTARINSDLKIALIINFLFSRRIIEETQLLDPYIDE